MSTDWVKQRHGGASRRAKGRPIQPSPADGNPGHAEACEWGAGLRVLCHWAGFDSKGAGGGVRKLKWRKSCSGFSGWREGLWLTSDLAWTMCLLAKTQIVTSKSSGTLDKKGNGAWIFLSPWSSGQLPGVRKISWLTTWNKQHCKS